MPPRILLGHSDFLTLHEDEGYYVDKSLFVATVLNAPAQAMLYPRPRRFGKTLNMTMLRAFLEIGPDRTTLFRGLKIWQDPYARKHFQRHPVITLSFKDVKSRSWPEALVGLRGILSAEVERHLPAYTGLSEASALRSRLEDVRGGGGDPTRALRDLCQALTEHHSERPVVLIDEYDAVVLTAWECGYYDEAVAFFRGLLSAGLKDNPFLYKAVLTGILRVARESMFSGLNNVQVFSLLHPDADEAFGFTEPEVLALLDEFSRSDAAEQVRHWYNGYRFGDTTVYNPISIMSMLAFPRSPFRSWWLGTSENSLVRSLLLQTTDLRAGMATLLSGGSVEAQISEDVALRDLSGEHVWGLLLFAGYLRADNVHVVEAVTFAKLRIPNAEVRSLWEGTFSQWLRDHSGGVEPLHSALLSGDAPGVERILAHMLRHSASFHDLSETQDEIFYHAFVLGLLVTLEKTHFVRSNRESGEGRPDLLLIPRRPGLPGVVLEFKRREGKRKLSTTALAAVRQLETLDYAAELEAAGASPVHKLGIAFGGREVAVRGASPAR